MLWLVAVPVALYALVCLAAWWFQDRLVWYPGPPPTLTPASIAAPFEDLELTARDGATVHAWHVHADDVPVVRGASAAHGPRGAVLICHGNAGNVENRLPLARAFRELGYDVLLFDYRGYGRSRGALSEEGTYLDGEAALDHLAARGFGPERTVVFGESLGGAVAVELARRRPVAALVVEDTFTALTDVGAEVYPWLPVRWISRARYDSLAKVPGIRVPFLVIHSPEDRLVPFQHGQRLHDAHPGPRALLTTSGGHGGGGFLQRDAWVERVGNFLGEHLRVR